MSLLLLVILLDCMILMINYYLYFFFFTDLVAFLNYATVKEIILHVLIKRKIVLQIFVLSLLILVFHSFNLQGHSHIILNCVQDLIGEIRFILSQKVLFTTHLAFYKTH